MNSKFDILNEIEKKVSFFKKVKHDQYKIRCVFCGDSANPDHAHMYLKCSTDPKEPILYHCFLCNAGGKVNKPFLSKLGITIDPGTSAYFNKLETFKPHSAIIAGTPNLDSKQYKYIQSRLRADFSIEELSKFRIVWDFSSIREIITDAKLRNTLPTNENSISFLTDDNSLLLTRFFDSDLRWRKSTLFNSNRSFYSIRKEIDLFQSKININIAEGVFDVLALYKNFYDDSGLYIASLGSDYCSVVDYVISLGFFGSSVSINFYLDSNIDEKNIKRKIKKYKWAFRELKLYKNLLDKDYGVPVNRIQLVEYKL